MPADHPHRTIWQPLSAREFGLQLGLDLRGDTETMPVHRLDRTQSPALQDIAPSRDVPGGRHTSAHLTARSDLVRHYTDIACWTHTRWVRVVDQPLEPVMHRELATLLLHAECGARIRVVTTAQVAPWEHDRRLTDTMTIGDHVTYQLIRDAVGHTLGAYRAVDARLARDWQHLIADLYARGEDASPFCLRSLRNSPNPTPTQPVVPVPRGARSTPTGVDPALHRGLPTGSRPPIPASGRPSLWSD